MLPLLNSAVRVVLGDSKVPGVGVLFKVGTDTWLIHRSGVASTHMHSLHTIESRRAKVQLHCVELCCSCFLF